MKDILLRHFESLGEDRSDESTAELARVISKSSKSIRAERDYFKKNLENARKESGKEDLEEQVANAREFLRIANGELHNHQKSLEELASEAAEKLKSSKKNEYIEALKREVHDMSMNVNDLQEELEKERKESEALRNIVGTFEKETGKRIEIGRGVGGHPVEIHIGELVDDMKIDPSKGVEQVQEKIKESIKHTLENMVPTSTHDTPPAEAHHRDGIYIGKARIRSIKLQGAHSFMDMNERKGGSYDYSENLSPDSEGKACGTRPPIGALDLLKDHIEQGDRVIAVSLENGMEEPAFSNCKTGEIYGIVEEAIRNAELDEEDEEPSGYDHIPYTDADRIKIAGTSIERARFIQKDGMMELNIRYIGNAYELELQTKQRTFVYEYRGDRLEDLIGAINRYVKDGDWKFCSGKFSWGEDGKNLTSEEILEAFKHADHV